MDNNVDLILTDVRHLCNYKPPHRKYTSTTVNGMLGLAFMCDHATSLLETLHVAQLLLVLVDSANALCHYLDEHIFWSCII